MFMLKLLYRIFPTAIMRHRQSRPEGLGKFGMAAGRMPG
jgi:hypothetical protein